MSAKRLAPLVPAAINALSKLAEAKAKDGNKATRQTSSQAGSELTAVALDALSIFAAATTKDGKKATKKPSTSSRDNLDDARPNVSRSAAAASSTASKGRDKTAQSWSSKSNTEKAIEAGQVVAKGVAIFLEQKQKAGQGTSGRAK